MEITNQEVDERPSNAWCAQCALSPVWCGLGWQCVGLERNGKMAEPPVYEEEYVHRVVYSK